MTPRNRANLAVAAVIVLLVVGVASTLWRVLGPMLDLAAILPQDFTLPCQ